MQLIARLCRALKFMTDEKCSGESREKGKLYHRVLPPLTLQAMVMESPSVYGPTTPLSSFPDSSSITGLDGATVQALQDNI